MSSPNKLKQYIMSCVAKEIIKKPVIKVLQKWEGYVEEVHEDYILVRLADLTSGGTDEEAEILLSDLYEKDLPLVEEGAIFDLVLFTKKSKFYCEPKFRRRVTLQNLH